MASTTAASISGVRKRKRSRSNYQIQIHEVPDIHVPLGFDFQRLVKVIPNISPSLRCFPSSPLAFRRP